MEKVVVLIYEHKSGTDLHVFKNMSRAKKAAVETIKEYLNDVSVKDIQKSILEKIGTRDYDGAIAEWQEYQVDSPQPEFLHLDEQEVN